MVLGRLQQLKLCIDRLQSNGNDSAMQECLFIFASCRDLAAIPFKLGECCNDDRLGMQIKV